MESRVHNERTSEAWALVVDANRLAASGLAIGLRARGLKVESVARAEQAVAALGGPRRPDLVFVDWALGLSFVERICARSPGLRVVCLRSAASARDFKSARAAGALDVISKPPSKDELDGVFAAIEAQVEGFRAQLDGLSIGDVLQLLHHGRRTTRLELGPATEIFMQAGEVVHARTELLEGVDALGEILQRPAGVIHTRRFTQCPQTIDRPFQHLLLDLYARSDEAAEAARLEKLVEHEIEVAFDQAAGTAPPLPAALATSADGSIEDSIESIEAIEAIEAGAIAPAEPVEFIESVEAESVEPIESIESIEAQSVEAIESIEADVVQLGDPIESIESIELIEAGDSIERAEAVDPGDSIERAEVVDPGESVALVVSVRRGDPIEPFVSVARGQPVEREAPAESIESFESFDGAPVRARPALDPAAGDDVLGLGLRPSRRVGALVWLALLGAGVVAWLLLREAPQASALRADAAVPASTGAGGAPASSTGSAADSDAGVPIDAGAAQADAQVRGDVDGQARGDADGQAPERAQPPVGLAPAPGTEARDAPAPATPDSATAAQDAPRPRPPARRRGARPRAPERARPSLVPAAGSPTAAPRPNIAPLPEEEPRGFAPPNR